MQKMDIVIFKGAINNRYSNITTCIAFSIQDTVIKIEKIDWSICTTFLLSG